MSHTARIAKSPAARTGRFAVLASLLRGGGSGVPSLRLIASLALATGALLSLTASPALAARGHVFKETFGTPCAAEPCGPGELKDPSALAVDEETHDVYVADQEATKGRVELFSAAGAFLSEITGPAATGTGELTNGSATVTGLTTESGAFTPGEQITAPGIEAGTTIAAVGAGSLELSAPATTTETAALSASQPFAEPLSIAIDNSAAIAASPSRGDLYVADGGNRVVDKFSASGEYLGQITESPIFGGAFHCVAGLTVDNAGRLLLAEANFGCASSPEVPAAVDTYSSDSPNLYLPPPIRFDAGFFSGFGLVPGFAFDSEGNFYIDNAGGGNFASKFSSQGKQIFEHFGPQNPTGVVAESSTDDVYVGGTDSLFRFTSEGSLIEQIVLPGSSPSGSGITLDQAAGTIYQGDAGSGRVAVFVTEPPSPPTIESSGPSKVTANSALFSAAINPRSETTEGPTTYRFEFGPCESLTTCPATYASSTPQGLITPDFEVHGVSASALGLSPATTYHVRVVTSNEAGGHLNVVHGPEKIFTTQSALASAALPDGRAWELVSPSDKHGAGFYELANSAAVIQASSSGEAITYLATAPTESAPAGYTNGESQVLSSQTAQGWSSRDIATPHEAATGGATGRNEYRAFSEDLTFGLTQPVGAFTRALSPQASEQTAFLRTNFFGESVGTPCATGCYRPLVTGCPLAPESCPAAIEEIANVPPGTLIEEGGLGCIAASCGPQFEAASADLRHIVLSSKLPLTAGAGDEGGLYEWTAGELTHLTPTFEGHALDELELGSKTIRKNLISSDGARVVLSGSVEGVFHLFLFDVAAEETIELDRVTDGTGEEPPSPNFQAASPSGDRILFTDNQHLMADSSGRSGDPDLYECHITGSPGARGCELTDLTPKAGPTPRVGGITHIVAASPDLSSVYFVANGVLAANQADHGGGLEEAQPGNCGEGLFPIESESCNLYLRRGGLTTFIARLSGFDFGDWSENQSNPSQWTARTSPSGGWLAFRSRRPLTGYDNVDALTGTPDQEVFLFHAGDSSLVCASCNPTGARPQAANQENAGTSRAGLAASLPGWTGQEIGVGRYQSRYLSDSGRLFFNASDAIAPTDTNGTWDVYQYEPPGVGSCTSSEPSFAPSSDGCVNLISSGTSGRESSFLDASESGDDVFFLTAARLSVRDIDTQPDVYDARVGGSEVPAVQPVRCTGDSCQQPAVPPVQVTPGTSLVNGPGNSVQCPKGKRLQRGKCVKQKAKKKHKRHKKSRKRVHERDGGAQK